MAQPFLSLIIPAYNEAERLPIALVDLDKHLSSQDYSYEVLVIDDGSKDATAKITANFAKMMKNIKLIHNDEHKGKGAAVRQGILLGRGKYRGFLDADNSLRLGHIEEALSLLKNGAHAVIGSRHGDSKIWPVLPLHRELMERTINLIAGPLLFGGIKERIKDINSGFKVFTDEAVERIFPHVTASGWGFALETLVLAKRFGYQIKEMPVSWVHDKSREMPYYGYLQVLVDIAKVRWRLRDTYKLKM